MNEWEQQIFREDILRSCSLVAGERRSTFKEHCYQVGALRNKVKGLIGGCIKPTLRYGQKVPQAPPPNQTRMYKDAYCYPES